MNTKQDKTNMFWKLFFDKYKTYLIVIVLCIIVFFAFTPVKNKLSDLYLSKTEIGKLKKENEALQKLNQNSIDSANFYKESYLREKLKTEESKKKTVEIKKKTNEEVNIIPSIPNDSNVQLFTNDMEEYLRTR